MEYLTTGACMTAISLRIILSEFSNTVVSNWNHPHLDPDAELHYSITGLEHQPLSVSPSITPHCAA
jgi:hypothetical protein